MTPDGVFNTKRKSRGTRYARLQIRNNSAVKLRKHMDKHKTQDTHEEKVT